MACALCGENHSSFSCPLFGKPADYVNHMLRQTPQLLPRKQQTTFQELFGDEIGLLEGLLESRSGEEQLLAAKVLQQGSLAGLTNREKQVLERVTAQLAESRGVLDKEEPPGQPVSEPQAPPIEE